MSINGHAPAPRAALGLDLRSAGYFVEVADLQNDATRAGHFGDKGWTQAPIGGSGFKSNQASVEA